MNIQKVENATAAYWARQAEQGKPRIMSDCLDMIKAMYGVDAVPVARDYIVKNICNIQETPARSVSALAVLGDTHAILDDIERENYADMLEAFAPAINDRSNKD